MHAEKRELLRIAVAMEAHLSQHHRPPVELPWTRWYKVRRLSTHADFCRAHGMSHSERKVRDQLRWELQRLSQEARYQAEQIADNEPPHRASLADIYRDVLALEEEFAELAVDLEQGLLTVTTPPIVLKEVNLGPFAIELRYRHIAVSEPYRVIALQPNIPPGHSGVTHPHVQDDSLCEGDASDAIRQALATGRIFDFFELVAQVLSTLGKSVHVDITDWEGVPCEDCDDRVSIDDVVYCDRCRARVCGSCTSRCRYCESACCAHCVSTCHVCDNTCCQACQRPCGACGESTCPECRQENLCAVCHANLLETDQHATVLNEPSIEERSTMEPPIEEPSPPFASVEPTAAGTTSLAI